jgi:hypothetical protein
LQQTLSTTPYLPSSGDMDEQGRGEHNKTKYENMFGTAHDKKYP